MQNLFTELDAQAINEVAPLAVRMRPKTLGEVVGQLPVLGQGTWLRSAIESDTLSSIILFGPAGTGKTTLARVIASATKAHFTEVSAISGGVSDLRREISDARSRLTAQNMRTILFVDEIHRFSRSQQDALLHAVEDRVLILIGATTENPFFEVNTALISRSRVVEFKTLSDADIESIVRRALTDERGLAAAFELSDAATRAIITLAGGDARMALTTLELAAEVARSESELEAEERDEFAQLTAKRAAASKKAGGKKAGTTKTDSKAGAAKAEQATSTAEPPRGEQATDTAEPPQGEQAKSTAQLPQKYISTAAVLEASPRRILPYDKKGDTHYDVISAFIKSMRGSDPDAAVYWLARMIEGGEDPKFIARRILIFASEDVGNADPQALLVAQAAFFAAQTIGYPECQLNLSQAAIYMALAPKSNSATNAIFSALAEVRSGKARAVPNHLRDRHRPGSEDYGKYHYPHMDARGYVEQQYLPDGLTRGAFYTAGERGWEAYRSDATKRDRQKLQDNDG